MPAEPSLTTSEGEGFAPLALPEGESVSGAPMPGVRMKAEKKLTMPRKKVMGKIKRETNPAVMALSEADEAELVADPASSSDKAE